MKKYPWTGLALASLIPALPAAEPAVARHFWDFEDENARYADRIGGVDGTVTEATTVLVSEGHDAGGSAMNTAATIATANDFVALNGADAGFFQPGTGAFSMSLWFRMPMETNNNRGIFDFSGNSADGPQMLLTGTNNSLNFRVDGDGGYFVLATMPNSTVEDDQWHFVAAVYDPELATDTLKVYLDGATVTATASRGEDTAATTVVSPASCWLGTFNYAINTTQNNGTDGDLDDVAYYSGALSEAQIGQLFAGTLQPTDLAPPPDITLTSYQRDAVTGASTLKWLSVADTEYTVWGSTNLSGWTEVTVSPVTGTGGEVEFSHTPAGDPPVFFYQVRDN